MAVFRRKEFFFFEDFHGVTVHTLIDQYSCSYHRQPAFIKFRDSSLLGRRRFALLLQGSIFRCRRSSSSSITKWAASISHERFYLKSPNFTGTSMPTSFIATVYMSSLSYREKLSKMTASGEIFQEQFKWWSRSFYTLIDNNRPHKRAGYDVTSCFRSAAKWN